MPSSGKLPAPNLSRNHRPDGKLFIGGIERGMIFWGEVEERETRDSEQFHGRNDPCPWVVLSQPAVHRKLPIVIAAPLSSKLDKDAGEFRHYRIRLLESLLSKYEVPAGTHSLAGDSLVLVEQMRILAHTRLIGDPIGLVSRSGLFAIEAGVKYVLGIP